MCKETNITLQDGCFGVATLMRIAALFIPSDKPAKKADNSAPQSTPALPERPDSPASTSRAIRDTADAGLEASTGAAARDSAETVPDTADASASDGVDNCDAGTPTKDGEVATVEQVGGATNEEDTGGKSSSSVDESEGIQQDPDESASNGGEDGLRGGAATVDDDPQETPGTSATPLPGRSAQSDSAPLASEEVPLPHSNSLPGIHSVLPDLPDLPNDIVPAPSSAAPAESETFRERSEDICNAALGSKAENTQQPEGSSDSKAGSLTADSAGTPDREADEENTSLREIEAGTHKSGAGAAIKDRAATKGVASPAAGNESGVESGGEDVLRREDSEAKPVPKADRFSIEVLRCRAVSPDWQVRLQMLALGPGA